MDVPPFDDDAAWRTWQVEWRMRGDTIYLNHGSFGPPPVTVRAAREAWQRKLDDQPMDFFVRQFEPAWFDARDRLAAFVGSAAENVIFVENATAGMNLVAENFPLRTKRSGGFDQSRIWCRRADLEASVPARRCRSARCRPFARAI